MAYHTPTYATNPLFVQSTNKETFKRNNYAKF